MSFQLPKITLNKDQQQKIFLSFLLLCFVIYGYFEFLLKPLQVSVGRAKTESASLEKKIAEANVRLRGLGDLKTKAAAASGLIAQAQAFIPDGAPVAWYPPRVKGFFTRQGFPKDSVSVVNKGNDSSGDREFDKKFVISNWQMQIPNADFFTLAIALTGLENEEVMTEITSLTIAMRENPELVSCTFEVHSILKAQ
ncbi:MAG: hypothetical protein JSR82_01530 [Verrucomicrobia bacterium]|nr:hypothetical protein [Verrucomicrobiota bacterium]